VHVKALRQASLIEFPGRIADIAFVGGCNFRCPFCYNVDLVLRPGELADLEMPKLLHDLQGRRGFVDGLAVTGGEPVLQPDLLEFLSSVKRLDLAIKLDTNGSRPDVLQRCLEQRLVDYVAMDLKTGFSHYEQAAGRPVDVDRLQQSISLLLHSNIEYEFRTTVVTRLVGLEDIAEILEAISGARRYCLQAFRSGPTVGWVDAAPPDPPSVELLQTMAEMAAHHVADVCIRGQSSES
jgi:pyruvate formate lyase activating enzyme